MIPFGIDISDIVDEFAILADKSEELSSFMLGKVVENYMFTWEEMVRNELKSTRGEYMKSMFTEPIDNNTAVVGLLPRESNLAMMIEDGASSFDEKIGFENSSKKKEKADGGWYLTIPFRYATTEAIGESMSFANKMPAQIQKVAKKVSPQAIAMQDLPKQYQKIGVNKTSGYTHKNPIFEGITKRNVASTVNEKRSAYMGFRRVSDKSDADSFIHPGFEARKFMERTLSEMESSLSEIIDSAVDEYLRALE